MQNERAEQLRLVLSVFSLDKIHQVVFVKVDAAKWCVHVKVAEMTKIQFVLYRNSPLTKRDMKYTATVINDESSSDGDFTIVLDTSKGESEELPQTGRLVPIVTITHAMSLQSTNN